MQKYPAINDPIKFLIFNCKKGICDFIGLQRDICVRPLYVCIILYNLVTSKWMNLNKWGIITFISFSSVIYNIRK